MRSSASSEVIACSMPRSSGSAGLGADRDHDPLGPMDARRRPRPRAARSPARAPRISSTPDALEHVDVDAVEPVDLAIARRDQRAPVERPARPAASHRPWPTSKLLGEMRAIAHELLGDAAADHAGPADPVVLAQRDPGAMGRRPPRTGDTARAAPDHEQIETPPRQTPPASSAAGLARPRGGPIAWRLPTARFELINRLGAARPIASRARIRPKPIPAAAPVDRGSIWSRFRTAGLGRTCRQYRPDADLARDVGL